MYLKRFEILLQRYVGEEWVAVDNEHPVHNITQENRNQIKLRHL